MYATDFSTVSTHLYELLGIKLTEHLHIRKEETLKDFAVVGSLVVLYRYAEVLQRKLVVHDMTTGGHKSHLLGTELDFDMDKGRKNPMTQLHITSDLLRIQATLRSELDAFRIGFYFDYLLNTEAETLAQFKAMYGGEKTPVSMHLGVRYKWKSVEYQGRPMPDKAVTFGICGKGSKSHKNSYLWTNRIRSWNVGFLSSRVEDLALRTIATDFRALDYNPPPLAAS